MKVIEARSASSNNCQDLVLAFPLFIVDMLQVADKQEAFSHPQIEVHAT